MPRNALAHVEVNYVLRLSEIAAVLTNLANGTASAPRSPQAQAPQELRK